MTVEKAIFSNEPDRFNTIHVELSSPHTTQSEARSAGLVEDDELGISQSREDKLKVREHTRMEEAGKVWVKEHMTKRTLHSR